MTGGYTTLGKNEGRPTHPHTPTPPHPSTLHTAPRSNIAAPEEGGSSSQV